MSAKTMRVPLAVIVIFVLGYGPGICRAASITWTSVYIHPIRPHTGLWCVPVGLWTPLYLESYGVTRPRLRSDS